jgi:excisionase family DNA binding protein
MQEWFTITEVANKLGVHRTTVWRMIKEGKMKYQIVGGKKRIHYTELQNKEK